MTLGITFFNQNFYFTRMTMMNFGLTIFNDIPYNNSALLNYTFNVYVEEQLVNFF